MIKRILRKIGAIPMVDEFEVTTQCPVFWPDWAFEYMINNPYTELLPGDTLLRNADSGFVWRRAD